MAAYLNLVLAFGVMFLWVGMMGMMYVNRTQVPARYFLPLMASVSLGVVGIIGSWYPVHGDPDTIPVLQFWAGFFRAMSIIFLLTYFAVRLKRS